MCKTFWRSVRGRYYLVGLGVLCLLMAARFVNGWHPKAGDMMLANGEELFLHEWSPHDALAAAGDGLGPVFNARSCVACHFQGGVGGSGANSHNVVSFQVFPTRHDPLLRAGVVHADAIRSDLQETPANVARLFPIVKGEIRTVNGCTVTIPDFNPVVYAHLNTPALFGVGLIDRMSDWSARVDAAGRTVHRIVNELQGDFTGPPLGRIHQLPDGRIGRFGWKAQFASLEEFVAEACAVEVGLTNPLRRQDLAQEHRAAQDAKLDLDNHQFASLVAFVRNLPRPSQVLPAGPDKLLVVRHGEELFASIGCADCHRPDMGGIPGIYSDLRLHRIAGASSGRSYHEQLLDDGLPRDRPKVDEWKTPPLWGVADSAPYMHDGSAPTLKSAILQHGGQAKRSRKLYRHLPGVEKQALLAFLKTLRGPRETSDSMLVASSSRSFSKTETH